MEGTETARAKLDSPKALGAYIRVTSRMVWLVLFVIIALLLAAVAWGVFGTLEVRDAVTGVVEARHPISFVVN